MNQPSPKSPRFALGQVFATRGAIALLQRAGVSGISLLQRHVTGDWGELDAEDKATNELAIEQRLRLMSSYHVEVPYPDSPRTLREVIWIITEADRSATTFLLPEEY